MLDDFRKSINSILYERMTSPLYGTLAISWLIWNWKIVYLTLFVSEKNICGTKIDYILANYNNPHILLTGPLVSTLVLITAMPLVSNGAYWLSLIYDKWKYDKKNEVEKSKLLNLEQSIKIRNEIAEQEDRFNKLISAKDTDIGILRKQVSDLTTTNNNNIDAQNKLRIIRAIYGIGEKKADVTKYLNEAIKENRLDIIINNNLFGGQDPAVGEQKEIEIIYEINKTIKTRIVKEGEKIIIED